jgi:hypothetical protein
MRLFRKSKLSEFMWQVAWDLREAELKAINDYFRGIFRDALLFCLDTSGCPRCQSIETDSALLIRKCHSCGRVYNGVQSAHALVAREKGKK